MELEQAKEVVANMATREPAVYTKREQTSSWNRVYELAGETNYTRNGITISNTESVKLEYWDGESIDLSGLVVKYTGDNAYTEAVEKAELDDVCENWQSETSTARIESDDSVVDNKVTKMITVSATENPSWTAEVEITVKKAIPVGIEAVFVDDYKYEITENVYVYQNTKNFYYYGYYGDLTKANIEYKLHWSSGSVDDEYTIATDDMISADTSALRETTVTVTYTDPASGVSVSTSRPIPVEVTKYNIIPVTVTSIGTYEYKMEVVSGAQLPDDVTYENGELLYNSEPIYISGDPYRDDWNTTSISNDTDGDGVYDPFSDEASELGMIALPFSRLYQENGLNIGTKIIYTIQPDESWGENGISGTYKYFKYTDTGLKLMVVS